MSREKKPKKTEIEALRRNQLAQLEQVIATLTEKLANLGVMRKKLALLQSVSLGLYDELDKLSKKAPADEVTDLVLEQVNDVIRESRALMPEDPYVQRLQVFVAAGDNPEHRDAVVVMRQVRQGLERLDADIELRRTRWAESLADANGVKVAVDIYFEGAEEISDEDFKYNEVAVRRRWMSAGDAYGAKPMFLFEVLDRTDIPTYFNAE